MRKIFYHHNDFFETVSRKAAAVWRFYYDGFRSMTVGRTLWVMILLKLFVFFVIMKMLFFPDILKRDFDTDEERASHVRHELTTR